MEKNESKELVKAVLSLVTSNRELSKSIDKLAKAVSDNVTASQTLSVKTSALSTEIDKLSLKTNS